MLNEPAAQGVQVGEPTLLKLPAWHWLQLVLLTDPLLGLKVPAGHWLQLIAPLMGLKLPAGHWLQLAEPFAALKAPGKQRSHVAAATLYDVPAAHIVQRGSRNESAGHRRKTTALPGLEPVPRMMYGPLATAQRKLWSTSAPEALPMYVGVPPLNWKTTTMPPLAPKMMFCPMAAEG